MNNVRIPLQRQPVQILRGLIQEIRKTNAKVKAQDNEMVQHLIQEARHLLTTDERTCYARNEQLFLAETYLTYLQSGRQYQQIHSSYTGKGERSVQETAGIVGFKLPHDPK